MDQELSITLVYRAFGRSITRAMKITRRLYAENTTLSVTLTSYAVGRADRRNPLNDRANDHRVCNQESILACSLSPSRFYMA